MNDDRKPVKVLTFSVDLSASPEDVWKALSTAEGLQNWFPQAAKVDGSGVGSVVTFSFGPEMTWPTNVVAWDPGKHLRWGHEDMMGPGTAMLVDFYISSEGGKTRVRLVQSAFGASDAWDNLFEGTEPGWTYFLYNLRLYLEKHPGKNRRMFLNRFEVTLAREPAWKKLLSAAGGLLVATGGNVHVGDAVDVQLLDRVQRGIVDVILDGHVIAMRLPELADSILFIEFEVGQDSFHAGLYLSVYDPALASRLEEPYARALERVKNALR
ncbi:MAG TPA: SRPBCC domain-containing protein [Planctomycetota bacterium]|nr:SRPBCC domain-containing protein [Planctomycetota bacterium]